MQSSSSSSSSSGGSGSGGSAGGLSVNDLVASERPSKRAAKQKPTTTTSSIGNGMVVIASTCPLSCMAHYANVLVVGGEGGHVSAGEGDGDVFFEC